MDVEVETTMGPAGRCSNHAGEVLAGWHGEAGIALDHAAHVQQLNSIVPV